MSKLAFTLNNARADFFMLRRFDLISKQRPAIPANHQCVMKCSSCASVGFCASLAFGCTFATILCSIHFYGKDF
jgi:hypothetical protein